MCQGNAGPKRYFTAYESPLAIFHDYRYHPEFDSKVAGKFKSLTYSNKINADAMLCQNELSSGVCHEANCTDQHFANMGVNGAQ